MYCKLSQNFSTTALNFVLIEALCIVNFFMQEYKEIKNIVLIEALCIVNAGYRRLRF